MEILTGLWSNIEAITIGGVSILILTNALTQAVKKLIPLDSRITAYIVGVILALLALGLGWQQILAGLVVGYLAQSFYQVIHKE